MNGNPVNYTDPTGLAANGASSSNASAYPAPDTSMIVACAPLCTGLGVLPPPPVGGYQGLQQEKPGNDGYQQLFGGQTSPPPSVGQQIGNAIGGFVNDSIDGAKNLGNLIFNEAKTPGDVFKPGGTYIGKPGDNSGVRVMPGGAQGAQDFFDEATKALGGQVVDKPTYPGTAVQVPGGGFIGLRPDSKSGPPTVDVKIPGLGIREIKFK